MANAERQVAGVGPGATDQPFYQMSVSTNGTALQPFQKPLYPFEINAYKSRLFDVFEKTITLRTDLEKSLKNPSIKDSEKVAIRKCIKKLDFVNKQLMDIPDYLDSFSVEK